MDKKKLIINYLKREKQAPTSKIGIFISANYYTVEFLLKEMEKEGFVKSELTKKGVIWRLKWVT